MRQSGHAGGELTFVKTIHVELSHEGRNVGVLEVLATENSQHLSSAIETGATYARTFEKSFVGDTTKLSAELDQLIKF